MSPWLLHRHPQLWDDPEAFRPERFLEGVDRFSHIPFGAGPRLCIGRDFSYVESVLMVAELARRFTVRLPPGQSLPEGEPLVTIRPQGGMPLLVEPR